MLIVGIAWGYVALMMAVAEATSPQGTVLGALFTFLLYGVLPLGIVLYLMATPARRRLRAAREGRPEGSAAPFEPDRADHAAGDTVAAERKEP